MPLTAGRPYTLSNGLPIRRRAQLDVLLLCTYIPVHYTYEYSYRCCAQAAHFRGAGDAAEDVLLYSVSTTAAGVESVASDTALPLLSSGSLISGLAAAVIQHREVQCRAAPRRHCA